MRDNHDGYPELLDAYEREGSYFGAVRVIVTGEVAAFECLSVAALIERHWMGEDFSQRIKFDFRGRDYVVHDAQQIFRLDEDIARDQ